MNKLNSIAFAVEYEYTYGGAQRLAAILAKRFKKKLYNISESYGTGMCWNMKVINGIPKEPIIFSITVDKYKPLVLMHKKQIKFMHSLGTIDTSKRYKSTLKQFVWVTHRKRVYKHARELKFDVHFIKNGYIPYDYIKLPKLSIKDKENGILSISRISPEKNLENVIKLSSVTDLPITIFGSTSNLIYFNKIKKLSKGKNIKFSQNVLERDKIKLLRRFKILVNTTNGKYRDYLEYSILDGMLYGCIPLCITKDEKQFEIIKNKNLGIVINNMENAEEAIEKILYNYNYYYLNCHKFMKNFLTEQKNILSAYEEKLKELELIIKKHCN